MDKILSDLGGLLLRALPTFLIVILLHFYLKYLLFKPLDTALEVRRKATEGARTAAETTFQEASRKAAEYEAAIRAARSEIYKEQEETRRKWRQQQDGALGESRRSASEMVQKARLQLAGEAADAKRMLAGEGDRLATAIAESFLRGNPS